MIKYFRRNWKACLVAAYAVAMAAGFVAASGCNTVSGFATDLAGASDGLRDAMVRDRAE